MNQLSGAVTYSSGACGSAKARPFMKVREGDRFTLPAGAQARIVYFQGMIWGGATLATQWTATC